MCRYKLEGQNLHTRFPHQFEPFMSLLPTLLAQNVDVLAAARPAVSGSDRRGDAALQAMGPFPVAGTIIRAPFRSKVRQPVRVSSIWLTWPRAAVS